MFQLMQFVSRAMHNMHMEINLPPDLISLPAAAKLIAVHGSTLRRWIASGKLAAWRVGGCYRVSRQDVLALVKPHEPVEGPRPMTMEERRAKDAETDRVLKAAGVRK